MQDNNRIKIQILIDDENSWLHKHIRGLTDLLTAKNYFVKLCRNEEEVENGDVLFLLGCTKIFNKYSLNKYNLVVHESNLPEGRGWSPLTWQILEGRNQIPITLFEAEEKVDAGYIYYQDLVILDGSELFEEIKFKQFESTVKLVLKFLENYNNLAPFPQQGEVSYYKRRGPKDSELDVSKSISEQFNLLRVADNNNYPAFFYFKNQKYIVKIFKENKNE